MLTGCSSSDSIVDQEYKLSELKHWNYDKYVSKHQSENFSSLQPNDKSILNYFSKNFHKYDLLNVIVNYYDLLTENDMVKDTTGNTVPLMDCLSEDTKLLVAYIKEVNSGQFHFSVSLLCELNQAITITISSHHEPIEIPVPQDAVVELQTYNNDDYKVSIGDAYYRNNDDPTKQEYAGNNCKLVASGQDPDKAGTFFIETKIGEETYPDYLAWVSVKNSWSDLPIKGFDDVKLPAIDGSTLNSQI